MADTIVIYYSLDGNCEMVAGHAARFAEADLVRIKTYKEIPKKGPMKMIKGGAGVVFGKKPKIVPEHVDLSGYENVILCYPIWAGSFPPAMNTFLSENALHAPLYQKTSGDRRLAQERFRAPMRLTGARRRPLRRSGRPPQ